MFKKNVFLSTVLLLSSIFLYAQPKLNCYVGLSIDLLPTTNEVPLYASYFVADASDKKYDIKDLKFKIQIPAASSNAIYDASKAKEVVSVSCVGILPITLWAINPDGETDRCDTYADIQNNMGATPIAGGCQGILSGTCTLPNVKNVSLAFKVGYGNIISETKLSYSDVPNGVPTVVFPSQPLIKKTIHNCVPLDKYFNIDFTDFEQKTNPLTGVSTFDLVLMSKHILGVVVIKDTFLLTAADVNNNGVVSTSDIVELRKMILGITTKFRNNTSWKYYPKYKPTAISNLSYSYKITSDSLLIFSMLKIGDINLSALAATPKSDKKYYFELENPTLQSGETYRLVLENKQLDGFQAALKYDTEALELKQSDAFSTVFSDGIIRTVQLKGEQTELVFYVKKKVLLSDVIRIDEEQLPAEVYQGNEIQELALRFKQVKATTFELYPNYPNPTTERTTIQFQAPEAAIYQLNVFDSNGKSIHSFVNQAISGLNQFEISIPQSGIYTYQIIYEGETFQGKIVSIR
jgi:hypothetical protein